MAYPVMAYLKQDTVLKKGPYSYDLYLTGHGGHGKERQSEDSNPLRTGGDMAKP